MIGCGEQLEDERQSDEFLSKFWGKLSFIIREENQSAIVMRKPADQKSANRCLGPVTVCSTWSCFCLLSEEVDGQKESCIFGFSVANHLKVTLQDLIEIYFSGCLFSGFVIRFRLASRTKCYPFSYIAFRFSLSQSFLADLTMHCGVGIRKLK